MTKKISNSMRLFEKGRQLVDKGRYDEGINTLNEFIHSGNGKNHQNNEARFNIAVAYYKTNQPAFALEHLCLVIAANPDWAMPYALRGEVLRSFDRFDEAIINYQLALERDENNVLALSFLGLLTLTYLSNPEESARLLKKAIKLKPSDDIAHMSLAMALGSLGEIEQALWHGKKAIKLAPNSFSHYGRLASILQHLGEKDEATRLLEKACALNSAYGMGYYRLSMTLKFDSSHRGFIQKMEDALALPMPTLERDSLHFALGKAYDDLKEWKQAFYHYRRGNSLVHVSYDYRAKKKETNGLIKLFDKTFFFRKQATTLPDEPIFIVGMPRSGSTLIEQILSSHSKVQGVGESFVLGQLIDEVGAKRSGDKSYPLWLNELSNSELTQLGRDYVSRSYQDSGTERVRIADKQLFHYAILGLIALIFPRAKIIHTRRHPLDTCLSCYFQRFETGLQWSFDLVSLGQHFREYQKIMHHWSKVLPIPIFNIDYESVVAEPEKQIKKLLVFCELEWQPQILSFFDQKRAVHTASHEQVRQPIYHRSIARWVHYAPFLDSLITALGKEAFTCAQLEELKMAGIKPRHTLFR